MTAVSGATEQVRRLINDTGESQDFTNDVIQASLEQSAFRFFEGFILDTRRTLVPGGQFEYKVFQAARPFLWWSSETKILDQQYNELTPDLVDLDNGIWQFNTNQDGKWPLYAVGTSYAPWNAAAQLLNERVALTAEEVGSFAVYNANFSYPTEGKRQGWLDLIGQLKKDANYRRLPKQMVRTDVNTWDHYGY